MNSHDEQLLSLEEALWRDPLDDATWRVYADRLESQGDPTATFIRHGLESEPSATQDPWFRLPGLLHLAITWKRKRDFQPHRLRPLPCRGLHVQNAVESPLAQRALARLLDTRLHELPRVLVFLQDLPLGGGELEGSLVQALRRLPLQQLSISNRHRGSQKYTLEALPAVQHLSLRGVPLAHELSDHAELPLRTLVFEASHRKLSFLARLPHLERLGLSARKRVELGALADCPHLHTLRLEGLRLQTSDLEPLAALPLRHLELSCIEGDPLGALAQVPSLETLRLYWMEEPLDLTPLAALPALRHVEISNCPGGLDLLPLASLPSLQSLELRDAGDTQNLAEVQRAHPGLALDHYEDAGE